MNKNTRLIQEEINRAKHLSGYDVSLTLNEQQLGDANSDGIVDQLDVDWVNSNWLQPGDVHDSSDGIVNLEDLTLVTNNFGQGQSSGGGSCDAPTSLNVTNITPTTATLNWGAVTNATSYEVVSSEQGSSAWVNLPNVTNPTTDNTGLQSSTTYEFAVRSVCSTGPSDWSVGNSGYQESGITPELYDTAVPSGSGGPPTPPPGTPPTPGQAAQVQMGICDCPNGGCDSQYTLPNMSQMSSSYLTVDNQTPVVGDKVYSPCMPQSAGQCTWEITAVGGGGTSQGDRQSSTDCDTPTTGGPTPPPPSAPPPATPSCNKSCQQLAPRFKKVVRTNMGKRKNPKRWLTNRLERLNNKLEKAKGQCRQKRLKCKIAVLKATLKRG